MNIVIANGPGRLDNGADVILFPSRWDSAVQQAPFRFYPYELALLSTLLKRELSGATVTMLDGNIRQWNGDRYAAEIARLAPDMLICECSALTYSTMTRVMQSSGAARNILCGPMATYAGAQVDGWTDCITGEYEHKLLSLLQGEPMPTGYIDLDWLPWPEDEDIDRGSYREINHYIDYNSDAVVPQVYFSRGCPLACSFCVVPTYYGGHGKSHRSHRCRDVEDCCEEILYLKRMYGDRMRGVYANEEAHNANVPWLMELCEAFIRHGIKDKHNLFIDAMCGAWVMTEELTALMARAGYRQFRFGVESTSEKVGRAIKKTIHKDLIENLLGWLKKHNIGAYTTLQVGAMGSTEETDLATLADARSWIQRGLVQKWQLSTSTPQFGTPFFEQAKANGWLVTEDFSYYNGWNAVVSYPGYSAAQIQAVRNGAGL